MSKLPSTGPSLQRWLRQQERKAQRQQQSSAFARSGTSVSAEGVVTVDGELDINGPLAVHGNAAFDGYTTIGGVDVVANLVAQQASLTATVSDLAAAVADIATLVSEQVTAAVAPAVTQTAWATTTSMVSKAGTTVTVPAGFTSALVTALGMVVFQDTAANRFDCQCVIEGTQGPTIISLANLTGSASPSQTRVMAVTGGQVLNIDVQVLSVVATGGMAANQAVITASVVFLR